MQAISKHVQGTGEITLIATLKTGLIPILESMSYASRLKILLEAFFADRKQDVERFRLPDGVLEELRVIHSVRWALINDERQLLLSVSFDAPWETYIRIIVERAGPFLDAIFSHCDDYAGNSCADGYAAFSAWVRGKQVASRFLYAATPDLTVDDIRYLKHFEQAHSEHSTQEPLERLAPALHVGPVVRGPSMFPFERAFTLFQLRALFPAAPELASAPDALAGPSDQQVFDRIARLILAPDLPFFASAVAAAASGTQRAAPSPIEAALFAWLIQLSRGLPSASVPPVEAVEARETVQGNLLTAYSAIEKREMTHGCVALLRFDDARAGAGFLSNLLEQDRITTEPAQGAAQPADTRGQPKLNLALTYAGLRQLGLGEQLLARFPQEFQEGMQQRAAMLGDVGANHPENWRLPVANWPSDDGPEGVRMSSIDAVLVLQVAADVGAEQAADPGLLPLLREELEEVTRLRGVDVLHVLPLRSQPGHGHFGLADGLSQPVVRSEANAAGVAARDQVALGELLLGYLNDRGERGPLLPSELSKNSSFVVLRKMAQDVAGFRESLANPRWQEKALGRSRDGRPLTESRAGAPSNAFDYTADPNGNQCPLFAHVRRANPRAPGESTPRILRRGMSYGPEYSESEAPNSVDRGVLFMAHVASIADQFEVVQRWVNGGNSTGTLSAHPDLIAGTFPENSQRKLPFIDGETLEHIPLPRKPLSTLQWGLYAFLPSATAVRFLVRVAEGEPAGRAEATCPRGRAQAPGVSLDTKDASEWKQLLEDGSRRADASALWKQVREEAAGALDTPYAVLVGSERLVSDVLRDTRSFSVRDYWTRMRASIGGHYLGMDPEPQKLAGDDYTEQVRQNDYRLESTRPSAFIRGITRADAFAVAREFALAYLNGQAAVQETKSLDVLGFARAVICQVATRVFDLPEGLLSDAEDLPSTDGEFRCPLDLTQVSACIFNPLPTELVARRSEERGRLVRQRVSEAFAGLAERRFVQFLRAGEATSAALPDQIAARDDREQRALVGTLNGFSVPTYGTFVSVMYQWIASEELWRLKRRIRADLPYLLGDSPSAEALAPIEQALYAAMLRAPVPDLLHRRATVAKPYGSAELYPGAKLAVSLGSAAQENGQWQLLFGDTAQEPYPLHACPGKEMALGVLLGMSLAVLAQSSLRKRASLVLSFA